MRIVLRDDKPYTDKLKRLCSEWDMSPTQVLITLINLESNHGDCKDEKGTTRRNPSDQ
jgi:hypothetical protein